MFSVYRIGDAPICLEKKIYNSPEVVERLEQMFHGKCYLCEKADLQAPEIEHFEPHEGNPKLKYDWNNLYYSCARCNSIKSNRHRNLVDCCSDNIDVVRAIKCLMPRTPDGDVSITQEVNDIRVENTVLLLDRCFNEDGSALRGITRASLIETMYEYFCDFLKYRQIIVNRRTTPREKQDAKDALEVMLQNQFEFSAFWRWHVLTDRKLKNEVEDLINF
ncbi:HNH endonuclease [Photobacterium leiognathi]|uniref:HNH endonuclease n=1 Tax=Photobacterium leiognathi TaxID=553611 RepID=UPI003AF40AA0